MQSEEKALVLVFNINNLESAYAKCLNYINKIEDLYPTSQIEFKNDIDFKLQGCFIDGNLSTKSIIENINNYRLMNNKFFDEYKLISFLSNKNQDRIYLFNILCKTETIVNLRYISLIQDSLELSGLYKYSLSKMIFHIYFESESDYYRASHFLFCENTAKSGYQNNGMKFYEQIYYSYNGNVQKAQLNGIYSLRKIAPLIKITKDNYSLFAKSVEEILPELDFSQYDTLIDLKQKIDNQCFDLGTDSVYEVILKNTCMSYLIESNLLMEVTNIGTLYDKCSKMSFLSFFLFGALCMFIYESKENNISLNEIDTLIQEAQNVADGILQLIENAVSYSKSSYFSFRVYKYGTETYLERVYPSFLFNDETYYLEVLITDLNTVNNITNKFKENLDHYYDVDNTTKSQIKQTFQLSDFFKPNVQTQRLWDKLYNTGKNAAFHYGLQIFDTIINSASGYFSVASSPDFLIKEEDNYVGNYNRKKDAKDEINNIHFPGTNYIILMPLRIRYIQKSIGINTSLSYKDLKMAKKHTEIKISSTDILHELNDIKSSRLLSLNLDEKKKVVEEVANLLMDRMDDSAKNLKYLYIINVNNINKARPIEIFSKALILFLLSRQKVKRKCDIALIDCSQEFMLTFTRCFAIFYNKMGKCPAMKNHQIYLCSNDLFSEFLFAGENIASVQYSADYLSNSKGVYNYCLDIVSIVSAKRANGRKFVQKDVKITPFDVIISDGQYTLFEKRVYQDLLKDMQKEEFGCCLNDVHVRIGSKIHFSDRFFEAALLFNSSYFTSRFAYLLARDIMSNKQIQNIVLVGYETYSEILVNEVKKAIKCMYEVECRYIIFEQQDTPIFKYWDDTMVDSNFVIIVPINSTLTTHSKIIAELKKLRLKLQQSDKYKERILNFAVILVRDSKAGSSNKLSSLEKEYWEDINVVTRKVMIKTAYPNDVSYFVCINNQWEEPFECSCCFPKESLIDEKPILQVNKTSVVPMIMVGLKPDRNTSFDIMSKEKSNNSDCHNFEFLKDALVYGHFERRDNHFQYYFKTEKIFNSAKNHKNFVKWINETRSIINSQKVELINSGRNNIYDIIVAPIHHSNAAFVEEINEQVFRNASIVVNLDGEKEFRDNIKTKYSNLTSLYKNICSAQRSAVINFHFVDDTIVSGKTFNRAKSLIHSIFPSEAFSENNIVRVNLFQNVILLLNRCSKSTKYNYVNNPLNFISFINLSIPSMRNHKDACILCKLVKNYETLYKQSSCNEMADHWHAKLEKYSNNKTYLLNDESDKEKKERAYRRIVCTHNAFNALGEIENYKNDNEKVKTVIYSLINDKLKNESFSDNERMEYLISYIKVLSRPFLIYRKSILEEIFQFMLILLDYLISNEEDRSKLVNERVFINDMIEILAFISKYEKHEPKELIEVLLKTLISRLSGLNAKYAIRCQNIYKIINYFKKLYPEDDTEILFWYIKTIKRLIGLSNDASLCLWFEHVLVNEHEYKMKENKLEIDENTWELLYLENTSILYDGISELSSKYSYMNIAIKEYYFENFRRMINISYNGNMQDNKELIIFPSNSLDIELDKEHKNTGASIGNDLGQVVKSVVEYYKHLESEGNSTPIDASEYYIKLLDIIASITLANYTVMYGQDQFAFNNTDQKSKEISNENYHIEGSFYQIAKTKSKEVRFERKPIEDKRILTEINSNNSECIKRVRDTVFYFIEEENINFIIKLNNKHNNISAKDMYDFNVYPFQKIDPTFIIMYFAKNSELDEIRQIKDIFIKIRYILTFRYKLLNRLKNDFSNNLFMKNEFLKKDIRALSNDKAANHATTPFLQVCCETALTISKQNDCNSILAAKTLQLGAHSLISKLYARKILHELKRQKFNLVKGYKEPIPISILNSITYDRSGIEMMADVRVINECWSEKITYAQGCYHYIVYFIVALVENALKHSQQQGTSTKIKIEIYKEGKYLVIRNPIGLRNNNSEENGITLQTLDAYFKVVYSDKLLKEENEKYFMVKLPLYKS